MTCLPIEEKTIRGLKEYEAFRLSRVEAKIVTYEGTNPEVKCKHVNYGSFQITEYYSACEAKVIYLAKNGHMGMSKSLIYGSIVNLGIEHVASCSPEFLVNLIVHELVLLFLRGELFGIK